MSIIFDEREHAKLVLKSGTQTSQSKLFELALVATYLREENFDDKQIEIELHRVAKKSFKDYNKVRYSKLIDGIIKRSKKRTLKNPNPVIVTKSEIDTILAEKDVKCQKLMFVYLILAKYYKENNPNSDNYYVGCSDNDLFKLCDIYINREDKRLLVHYLQTQGYITPTLRKSSIVNYIDENSEVVFEIVPDDTMIYYFEKEYLDGIFINCERCGKLVKKTNNRIKYCKDCAKIVHYSGV